MANVEESKKINMIMRDIYDFAIYSPKGLLMDSESDTICKRCKKFVNYDEWIMYMEYPVDTLENEMYQYVHLFPDLPGMFCLECVGIMESWVLIGIEDKRLPLFINHEWLTSEGEQVYKKRLSQGVLL